jgi:arginine utilization regulatory protein
VTFRKKPQFKDSNFTTSSNFIETKKIENDLSLEDFMENAEKSYLEKALEKYDSNISKTAKALGMSRQSLQYRLRKYEINS